MAGTRCHDHGAIAPPLGGNFLFCTYVDGTFLRRLAATSLVLFWCADESFLRFNTTRINLIRQRSPRNDRVFARHNHPSHRKYIKTTRIPKARKQSLSTYRTAAYDRRRHLNVSSIYCPSIQLQAASLSGSLQILCIAHTRPTTTPEPPPSFSVSRSSAVDALIALHVYAAIMTSHLTKGCRAAHPFMPLSTHFPSRYPAVCFIDTPYGSE